MTFGIGISGLGPRLCGTTFVQVLVGQLDQRPGGIAYGHFLVRVRSTLVGGTDSLRCFFPGALQQKFRFLLHLGSSPAGPM